jgi:hypothetical protein
MVHAAVILDCQIIRVLLPMTDLQVVILRDELKKPATRVGTLFLSETVDVLPVVTNYMCLIG